MKNKFGVKSIKKNFGNGSCEEHIALLNTFYEIIILHINQNKFVEVLVRKSLALAMDILYLT